VTGSRNLQDEYVRHQPGLTAERKEIVMRRKSRKTGSPVANDTHASETPTVAAFTRKFLKRPRKQEPTSVVKLEILPELTDAWFDELIAQVDEATARSTV
jgi:hypothetical protein